MNEHPALSKWILAGLVSGGLGCFAAECHNQAAAAASPSLNTYPLVDTGQSGCYDTDGAMPCAKEGSPLHGQDADHQGLAASYLDNGDGTITDRITGLTWQRSPGEKVGWRQAVLGAAELELGGYADWRLPTIKELYSLIDFDGVTGHSVHDASPYLDTRYFDFEYGSRAMGERHIDAQYWSATEYVSTTMNGMHTVFGVNFADGRIKGYGTADPRRGGDKRMFVRYVRGNPDYGTNDFVDKGDGTVSDRATGRTWMQEDSGALTAPGAMDWEDALAFCEGLDFADHADWRLPDAKELQSIVDYTRSPATTGSAAIDPVFDVSELAGGAYPFFWTSTTHLDGRRVGDAAVYVAFGEARGWMAMPPHARNRRLLDVHGAGAQRSDPKTGSPAAFPYGRGPQGDVIGILNHVRCVRSE